MNRVKKPLGTIALLIAIIAVMASCASKPKAPEKPAEPAEPASVQPAAVEPAKPAASQEDLDKLLAEAKALKKQAFDLKLFEVLPDDYKAADGLLAEGQKAYDDKKMDEAKKGLESAVAAYKDLIARGVVEIANAKKKEAEDMKAVAEKAGADSSQAERFGAGDESFKAADELLGASKAEESIPGFEKSRQCYELAWKRSVAAELRQAIEDKGYAQWDSGNFQIADNKFQAEEGLWASGTEADRDAGVEALNEAILRYNLVVQKGKEYEVASIKKNADAERQRAEEIKADVAAKAEFEAAMGAYNDGNEQLNGRFYDDAASAFERSGTGFSEAYQLAAEKRAKAEAAMKAAAEAAAESKRKAAEAEPLVNSSAQ
jgi:hypothetical protein